MIILFSKFSRLMEKRKASAIRLSIVVMVASLSLSGCIGGGEDDIRQFLETERQSARPKPDPIPQTVPPEIYRHVPSGKPNPFDIVRFKSEDGPDNGNKPDQNRPQQILEAYSLTQVQMVGVVKDKGAATALISAGGKVHPIKVGEYMGQDYGRVTDIAPNGLTLLEQVQDAAGKWVSRETHVPLTEKN